jgi:hypothetical protein
MLDSTNAAPPAPDSVPPPAPLTPCSCGAPHPVLAGGEYVGPMRTSDGWELDEGVERLELWTCVGCRSTLAFAVPFATGAAEGAAVSHRTPGGAYLTDRGYVPADELGAGEAAHLAAAGVLHAVDVPRLAAHARTAVGNALGLELWSVGDRMLAGRMVRTRGRA